MNGLYFKEDAPHVEEVARAFNCPPCMIADECGVSPIRIELLMRKRGQIRDGGEYSLIEKIAEFYGEKTAKLVVSYGIKFIQMTNESEVVNGKV
jgi:hypothetical protein